MSNQDLCVFCGESLGFLGSAGIRCGDVFQPSCRSCAKELNDLSEEEQCRRALQLGLANEPEKVQERLELLEHAEERRPVCLRCGEKLRFQDSLFLDISPYRDGVFSPIFAVLPGCCPSCGKYEFYNPDIVKQNPVLSYLVKKDISG